VCYIDLITIGLYSFDKGIVKKRNIDWSNGVWFVHPKIKEGWEFMTFKSRIQLF
jgi:hypothetical protein